MFNVVSSSVNLLSNVGVIVTTASLAITGFEIAFVENLRRTGTRSA